MVMDALELAGAEGHEGPRWRATGAVRLVALGRSNQQSSTRRPLSASIGRRMGQRAQVPIESIAPSNDYLLACGLKGSRPLHPY